MGLADRFKKTLNSTDLFTSPDKDIPKLKPKTQTTATTPVSTGVIPAIGPIERAESKFNDLVVNTIKKIKNTPYWTDYSEAEQEKMVSRYFDIKIKAEKYSDVKVGLKEKCAFIQDVLARAKKL